jgi:ABC-type multidrug transport system fused ATPase/permease subunit
MQSRSHPGAEGGRIVERGNHVERLARGRTYARLVQTQLTVMPLS